jgi:hypothetical protein
LVKLNDGLVSWYNKGDVVPASDGKASFPIGSQVQVGPGMVGTVTGYDGSASPYLIKLSNGLVAWYTRDQVQAVDTKALSAQGSVVRSAQVPTGSAQAGSVKAPVVGSIKAGSKTGSVKAEGGMISNAIQKASDTVAAVENKVAEEVHAVHDKVSGFFGMIGGLFHSNTKPGVGKGPGGVGKGVGSTVDVTQGDGSKARGHIVQDDGNNHLVQLHTDPPGKTTLVPASSVAPAESYAPDVGAGVEVLYEGEWYSGYVVAVPTASQDPPVYQVSCHADDADQITLVDGTHIRPYLSTEEKDVVATHLSNIKADKEKAAAREAAEKAAAEAAKRKAAAEQAAALKKKADELEAKKTTFKEKMDDLGLSCFYPAFTANGYDTEDSLESLHDNELATFGMKPGHISKFYQGFPRGKPYVISNYYLQSTATGITYTATKNITDDSHKTADFGTTVQGTEQHGGWLKVGIMYLPMKVDGKQVIFLQGTEPKNKPSVVAPSEPEGMVAKVENTVKTSMDALEERLSGGLSAFEHMLHFK